MKKVISLVLSVLLFVFPLIPTVEALTQPESENQYFEDGSYITVGFMDQIDVEDEEDTESLSFIARLINMLKKILSYFFGQKTEVKTKSVSKTKYANYYDSKGNLLWSVYLTGVFSYDGKTAKCTNASVSHSINDSDWKLISATGSKQDATATGTFSVRQYKLGVPLKSIEKTFNLTCDKNGNVK